MPRMMPKMIRLAGMATGPWQSVRARLYWLLLNQHSGQTVKTIRNILSIPELRNRIFFTLGILAVFRLGGHVPTPGINADLLQQFFKRTKAPSSAWWTSSWAATSGD